MCKRTSEVDRLYAASELTSFRQLVSPSELSCVRKLLKESEPNYRTITHS